MNTYYWIINYMNTKPQEGNLMDVVVCVNWTRVGENTIDGKLYSTQSAGQFICTTPSETDFTAYPDLTYNQVCGWLDNGIDVAELDSYLDSQLELLINPPIVILPNPWVNPIPPPIV
jgi:hypothetical protein